MPRKRKQKTWEVLYRAGARGSTVCVVRTPRSPNLYVRWWRTDRQENGYRTLGHGNLERAKDEADILSAAVRKGRFAAACPTLVGILTRYEAERTPQVGERQQRDHRRLLDLWQRELGHDPELLSLPALVECYQERRLQEVRPRTVEAEVRFLMAVLRWASSSRPRGGRILSENPLEGHRPPIERNPRRPVASWTHWLRTYRFSDRVDPQGFLRAVLMVVETMGWRIGAVCQLRVNDVDIQPREHSPHGRMLKRAETDKMGVERWVPIPSSLRHTLERQLGRRGAAHSPWLFPAARARGKPWTRNHAQKLHRRAQTVAELPVLGFHAYRRKWATERKHLPSADVAYAGAWLNPRTLEIYQHPDDATVLAVIEGKR